MNLYEKLLHNIIKESSYDSFRTTFCLLLENCKKRENFFDDFESIDRLLFDTAINNQWLFDFYCEVFSNLEFVPFGVEYNMRFQLYLAAIESIVEIAEIDIFSDDSQKVSGAEIILGFYFSFLRVRTCWWMFEHHFEIPTNDDSRKSKFHLFFSRIRGYPHLLFSAKEAFDPDDDTYSSLAP